MVELTPTWVPFEVWAFVALVAYAAGRITGEIIAYRIWRT